MRKIALILLLGFGFTLSQAVAQDEEEIEYIEEYEDNAGSASDSTEEYTDDSATATSTESTANTASTSSTSNDSTDEAQLEPLDDIEFASDEDTEYVDDGEEYTEETTSDSTDDSELGLSSDYEGNDDTSDITRWHYTEKEIARKEEIRKRQAEREAEYEKSISRRRSGLFFGVGMGFSDTTIKGLASSFASGFLSGGGDGMSVMGIGVGAFAGWQVAFNEYAGVRMYGEFDYNLGKGIILAKVGDESIKADNNLWKALGNVDFYLEGSMGRNQTETLGFFFGLGAGYIFYKGGSGKKDGGAEVTWKSLHMIGLVVNYGIHTILGTNHRIELFVRNYPFMRVQTNTTYKNSDFTTNMDAWLRYSYMF